MLWRVFPVVSEVTCYPGWLSVLLNGWKYVVS